VTVQPTYSRAATSHPLPRPDRRALCVALVGLALSCDGRDIDRLWSAHEQRLSYPSPAAAGLPHETRPGEYEVFVPQGVDRLALTLAATESLTIGSDVEISDPAQEHKKVGLGVISSLGTLSIGAGSRVGAVYALGRSSPTLGEGVTVQFYGKSVLPFEAPGSDPAKFMSDVRPAIDGYRWGKPAPPPVAVSSGHVVTAERPAPPLPPGSYESLIVRGDEKVRLKPGTYFFDALVVERAGTLEIDDISGVVYIWVTRTLVIAGNIRKYSLQPSTLFGYHGSEPPSISAAFHGTLVAPNATIALPATAEPHIGGFFARAIRVADHAVVQHRTFMGWQQLFQDPSVACGICAISTRAAMRRCCANSYRPGTLEQLDAPPFIDGTDHDHSRRALDDYNGLEACLSRVIPTFLACEESAGLVSGVCERRDLGYRAPSSCGDY
jgi:hypothetical protein